MGDQDLGLMEMISDTEQLEIFKTKVVEDMIMFKWDHYGKYVHYTGLTFHTIYSLLLCFYVDQIYLKSNLSIKN